MILWSLIKEKRHHLRKKKLNLNMEMCRTSIMETDRSNKWIDSELHPQPAFLNLKRIFAEK